MGIEKKTKRIGEYEYEIETFGARQGMTVLLTLVRFIGPALSAALDSGGITEATLSKGLESFAKTATEADFAILVDAFAERTKVLFPTTTKAGPGVSRVNLKEIFDSHFAGSYKALIEWLIWAATENYGRFFADPPAA